MTGTTSIEVKLLTVASDSVGFSITKEGKPCPGAEVTLCTKGVLPISKSRTTDESGAVVFSSFDIIPELPSTEVWKGNWLFFVSADPDYGFWKDNAIFTPGKSYTFALKRYKEAPKFFIKMELKDVIGAELFGQVVASVEETALGWAGLEVIKVEGKGTRTITVVFSPPWHSSPIVIEWAAVWFILKVLAVAGAIIAILVVYKWTFGEWAAPLAMGLGLAAIVALLLLTRRKEEEKRTYQRL